MVQLIVEGIRGAMESEQYGAAHKYISTVLAYLYGKPVTRQISVKSDLEDFLAAFAPREGDNDEDSETDGEVVDSEVVG